MLNFSKRPDFLLRPRKRGQQDGDRRQSYVRDQNGHAASLPGGTPRLLRPTSGSMSRMILKVCRGWADCATVPAAPFMDVRGHAILTLVKIEATIVTQIADIKDDERLIFFPRSAISSTRRFVVCADSRLDLQTRG